MCDGIVCDGFIYKYLWDDLFALSDVVRWHYRGHGRSARPADPERVSVADQAADLGCIREHVGDSSGRAVRSQLRDAGLPRGLPPTT